MVSSVLLGEVVRYLDARGSFALCCVERAAAPWCL